MNLNNNLELHRRATKKTSKKVQMLELRRKLYAGISLATVFLMYALDVGNVQGFVGGALQKAREFAANNFDFPDETETLASAMTPTAELTTESPTHVETPTPTSTPRPETPTITPEQQLLVKIKEMSSDFKADNNCDGDCGPLDVEVKTVSIGGEHFFKYIVSPVGAHASKNVQDGRNGEGLYLPILDNQEEPGHVAQKFIPGILEDGVRVYYSPVVTSEKTYLNNTARFAPEDRKDRDIRWDLRTIKAVDSRGPAVAFDDANENNGYLVFQKLNDGWEEETIIPDQPTPVARIESAFTDQQRIATALMNLEEDPFKLDRGTRHISP